MIDTIIVDDEYGNVITLTEILNSYCPKVNIVATANNIDEAYNAIKSHTPQLVFLDIEMPNGNGFDLLNKIPSINFEVVFVTAFNNYAIKAIKFSAIDYILKPINIQEVQAAVEKVNQKLHKQDINIRLEHLMQNINSKQQPKRITIPTQDGLVFEDIESIMYLQASSNYTTIFTNKKYKVVAAKTVKEFEEMLPNNIFCRVHNSFIVNIDFVKKFQKQGRAGSVIMQDGTEIEVSIRKKDEFLAIINLHN